MTEQFWRDEYVKKSESEDAIAQSGRGNQFNAVEFLCVVKEAVELLDLRREHNLVDVGCGNGLLDIPLSAICRSITGIEPVAALAALARQNLADCPNVRIEVAHGGAIPAAENSFDRALIWGVIQLIAPEAARAMFRELRRVLRPGGRAVFASVPDARKRDDFLTPYLNGVRDAKHLSDAQKDAIVERNLAAQWHDPEELRFWWSELGGVAEIRPLSRNDPNASHRYHLILTAGSAKASFIPVGGSQPSALPGTVTSA